MKPVVVVGGGVSGLCAARVLGQAGRPVLLLDAGAAPGGKLRTKRVGAVRLDAGAPQISAADLWFVALLEQARSAGVARVFTEQLHDADGNPVGPAGLRWCGARGMSELARWIGDVPNVEWRGNTTVRSLADCPETAGAAAAVILALPPAATLQILAASGVAVESAVATALGTVRYEPTLVTLVELDAPPQLPESGFVVGNGQPLGCVIGCRDDGDGAGRGLTLLASIEWSREHVADADEAVAEALIRAAAPFIGSAAVMSQRVVRWESGIAPPLPATDDGPPAVVVAREQAPVLLACGVLRADRVEAAALAGRAAALHLLESAG